MGEGGSLNQCGFSRGSIRGLAAIRPFTVRFGCVRACVGRANGCGRNDYSVN